MIECLINGQQQRLPDALTVADVVAARGLRGRKIAVEVNRRIVPKSMLAQTPLREGDVIEIVSAVGGG